MSQEFKIGVKVREKTTGDEGRIVEKRDNSYDRWNVRWETGADRGQKLHISEDDMEIIYDEDEGNDVIENLRKLANSMGYDIIKL